MTDTSLSAQPESTLSAGAFYRLVWKWHFLASLYVLPVMLILSITGGLYLFKPQIEEWIYADRLNVDITGPALPYAAQVDAVQAAAGITRLRGINIDDQPGRTTVIEFNDVNKIRSYAWVNPYTAEVLAITPRDETAMRVLRTLHGELLGGDIGTKFVELAAHWAIVMFITGIYLWWPRGERRWRDVLALPRGAGRPWWRQAHLLVGGLAFVLIMPLLVSGLPWTDVWGGGLSYVQEQTGQKSKSLRFGGRAPGSETDSGQTITIAQVYDIARAQGLVPPYELRPPKNDKAAYWIRSASANRFDQTELIVDQYSGKVLKRFEFSENPVVAKTVSLGISFHQGELYGVANLVQNTLAALLGVALSVTGFIAWWMRRPKGSLGVPVAPSAALSTGMGALIVTLMIFLPLMGASLLLALILDWLLFKRLGWFGARTA